MTTGAERSWLLRIAREAIAAHVSRQPGVRRPPVAAAPPGALADRRAGVFVTIHHAGALRGCIGHVEADEPLPRIVARCAVAACSEDPRFDAICLPELPLLTVELSLLGPMERADGPPDVEIGRHGLMVEMERRRGLLLPQVAAEWRWDAVTFLAQTCRKAGLPADSWQRGATIWRFEAEVFGEISVTPNEERRT